MILQAIREVTGLHDCSDNDLPAEIAALIRQSDLQGALKPMDGWRWKLVADDAPVKVMKSPQGVPAGRFPGIWPVAPLPCGAVGFEVVSSTPLGFGRGAF